MVGLVTFAFRALKLAKRAIHMSQKGRDNLDWNQPLHSWAGV